MVTDCHSILVRWRNHFSQLLNVHGVRDVRQTEILTTEPPVPEHSAFHFQIPTEKLMGNKSPSTDQITVEMIKVGEIHKLITSIWNEWELTEEWKVSIIVPTRFVRKVIKQTVVIKQDYHFCQIHTKFYPTSCCQS